MTHTPGPWNWDSDPVKNDPLGRVRYRVTTIGKTITQVYYSSHSGGSLTNAEQDARLIAAAPDLLAALQALHSNGHLISFNGDTPEDIAISKAAIAAIAKATGAA